MTSANVLLGIGGWAVAWVVSAAMARGLVKNFRPQHLRNSWGLALAVTLGMSLIGVAMGVLLEGVAGQAVALVLQVALLAAGYRLGIGLSIGIGILIGILMLAVAHGAALALGMLAVFGPTGVLVGLIVGIGVPVASIIRNRIQERKMIDAYGAESIRR